MNTAPTLLMICRHSGWTAQAAACLETTLTAGVYEQHTALVLLEAAVTLLFPDQQNDGVRPKTQAQQLPALELYGIDTVYVEASALAAHGLADIALPIVVKPLQAGELATLVATARHTMVF
jgi:sulfur relay protein TusC/DsrF